MVHTTAKKVLGDTAEQTMGTSATSGNHSLFVVVLIVYSGPFSLGLPIFVVAVRLPGNFYILALEYSR